MELNAAMTRSAVASAQIAGRTSTAPSAMSQKATTTGDVLPLGVVLPLFSTCLPPLTEGNVTRSSHDLYMNALIVLPPQIFSNAGARQLYNGLWRWLLWRTQCLDRVTF